MIALFTIIGFVAGAVDAIGGGGGLICVPALMTAGVPVQAAIATNKAQSIWGTAIALLTFWRNGQIDRAQALRTFPLGIAGSAVGAVLVLWLDKETLRPIVIAMLIGAAVLLVARKPSRDVDLPPTPRHLTIAAILALVIGAYDGFFGPGTGTFLIVGFVAFCGKSLVRATADAKVVNFASNAAGLAVFISAGVVAWAYALPMAVGQLAGGFVGARVAIRGGARVVRIVVVAVSLALVVKLGVDLI